MKKFKKLTAGLLGVVMAMSVCSFTALAGDGNEVEIFDKASLATAIAGQADGQTWILNKDVDVTEMIFINTDVTIDGNNNTLNFTGNIYDAGGGKDSFIQIEDGADVTIRDLTIDGDSGVEGSEKVKHGINIFSYEADDQITKVTVDNVKIVDCGGYAITNNASEVVVESLETSGNLWGGINVDNSKKTAGTRKEGAKLTIKDAVINEDNSVYFENENYEAGTKVDAEIKDGEFAGTVAIGDPGATLEITGGEFEGAVGTVDGSDINIVSGRFSSDVSEYMAEGSKLVEEKDGNFVIMTEKEYENYLDSKRPTHSYSLEEGRVERDDKEDEKNEPVVTPEEEEGPFSDVGKDNPNYDAIIKVYENGWMAGIGDGVFAPNGTLTRGMGATVLWNKAGCPEPQNVAPFLDVTSDDWYAKAVAWAYEQGIVAGYGDVFGPDDALTTEQFERMSAIANGKTPEIYVGGAPNATRGWVASLLAM